MDSWLKSAEYWKVSPQVLSSGLLKFGFTFNMYPLHLSHDVLRCPFACEHSANVVYFYDGMCHKLISLWASVSLNDLHILHTVHTWKAWIRDPSCRSSSFDTAVEIVLILAPTRLSDRCVDRAVAVNRYQYGQAVSKILLEFFPCFVLFKLVANQEPNLKAGSLLLRFFT